MKKLILIVSLVLVSSGAWGFGGYKCTIKSAVEVNDEGVIEDNKLYRLAVGKDFTIDRLTGRMVGELSNHSAYGSPEILDSGSTVQSFKVLTVRHPRVFVDYLVVKEFVDSKEKPFYFTTDTSTFTGLCEHY